MAYMKDLILFNTAQSYHFFRTFAAVPRQKGGKHLNLLLMKQLLTHGETALNMVYNLFNEFDSWSLLDTFPYFKNHSASQVWHS